MARGLERSLLVVDMPFGSYEEGPEQAFANAVTIMRETGCGAVKLEGGQHMAGTIAFLTARGVPVMAHIGLTPQSINTLGGYKVQGRDDQADVLMADARAVADAGAFAVVLEKVPAVLAAARITKQVAIPTIGIGASAECDGQILVLEDMLGLNAWTPKFVKVYGDLGPAIDRAVSQYAQEVKDRSFPGEDEVYR